MFSFMYDLKEINKDYWKKKVCVCVCVRVCVCVCALSSALFVGPVM